MDTISIIGEYELLQRISEGDERAFAIIFRRHLKVLLPYLNKLGREDGILIIEVTFTTVWLCRDELPRIRYFREWILALAASGLIDIIRYKLVAECFGGNNNWKQLHEHQGSGGVDIIDKLTVRRGLIYVLNRLFGLSPAGIGKVRSLSITAVLRSIKSPLNVVRRAINRDKARR
ncbi:MAG TPA: hypothetical protein VM802_15095 [Chitinophaga sp.]|uniref:RNA polymerase sigma factor n=1 Tax=Chitinophaga sp. TaxID=1869181 RepID=UPI002C82380E|nr:hypothetical protein [Chitinophaga sp.]HVI46200.1 hypothetical protein [Chitinophaga sp.]